MNRLQIIPNYIIWVTMHNLLKRVPNEINAARLCYRDKIPNFLSLYLFNLTAFTINVSIFCCTSCIEICTGMLCLIMVKSTCILSLLLRKNILLNIAYFSQQKSKFRNTWFYYFRLQKYTYLVRNRNL